MRQADATRPYYVDRDTSVAPRGLEDPPWRALSRLVPTGWTRRPLHVEPHHSAEHSAASPIRGEPPDHLTDRGVVSTPGPKYNVGMRNLATCLREYPPIFLQALARLWLVEEPATAKDELAGQIASAMVAPGAVRPLLDSLGSVAREALAYVATKGGAVRGYLLTRRYGKIRPLGPNPLRRLEPWTHPENPSESLYYRGLIYRSYDILGDYHGEVLFIPPQLMAALPPLKYVHPSFNVIPVEAPASQQSDGDSLATDVLAILVYLRREEVLWTRDQFLTPGDLSALRPRLRGAASPARLTMIQRLMRGARLVVRQKRLVRPGRQAKHWLRSNTFERSQTLFETWRRDKGGHELRFVEGLRWESASGPYDAPAVRETILSRLAECPQDEWVSLASFVAALKNTIPDYLRPTGDYDSWYVRDTRTKRFLTGFESWDQVEGRLAAYLLTHPLRWLGVVATGPVEGSPPDCAFRLLPAGLALLQLRTSEAPAARTQPCTVDGDFVTRLAPDSSLYDRYQLERFAEWQGESDSSLSYRLTRESVWRGQAQGIEVAQIIAFLRRITDDRLPGEVLRALAEWGDRYGKVLLHSSFLIETVDEATMGHLQADPELAGLLAQQVSPRAALVGDGKLDLVMRRLKKLGHWPLLRSRDD